MGRYGWTISGRRKYRTNEERWMLAYLMRRSGMTYERIGYLMWVSSERAKQLVIRWRARSLSLMLKSLVSLGAYAIHSGARIKQDDWPVMWWRVRREP